VGKQASGSFLKKRTKKLLFLTLRVGTQVQMGKSFLLLFFKKVSHRPVGRPSLVKLVALLSRRYRVRVAGGKVDASMVLASP
jgi:hypothetical protein